MTALTVSESIDIAAPAERVWRVLTEPAFTQRYMFGCVPVTDWQPGGTLDWQGTLEGKPHLFVRGELIECAPPSRLSYTTYDPDAAEPDPPARRVRVTMQLSSPRPGVTRLDVTQGDFAGLPRAEARFAETQTGWTAVVAQVKTIAES
jgi:uncharacterized protein YndB with AHSA1/START domain